MGHDLESQGTIFGLGCDADTRCLIITYGGGAAISAQCSMRTGPR